MTNIYVSQVVVTRTCDHRVSIILVAVYYWLLAIQSTREDIALKIREEQLRQENRRDGERHVSNIS